MVIRDRALVGRSPLIAVSKTTWGAYEGLQKMVLYGSFFFSFFSHTHVASQSLPEKFQEIPREVLSFYDFVWQL